jgi:hypothetical protein
VCPLGTLFASGDKECEVTNVLSKWAPVLPTCVADALRQGLAGLLGMRVSLGPQDVLVVLERLQRECDEAEARHKPAAAGAPTSPVLLQGLLQGKPLVRQNDPRMHILEPLAKMYTFLAGKVEGAEGAPWLQRLAGRILFVPTESLGSAGEAAGIENLLPRKGRFFRPGTCWLGAERSRALGP